MPFSMLFSGITSYFFIFKMCLQKGRKGRGLWIQPLISPCGGCEASALAGRRKDNRASNWQGCPATPPLSPTTWPCPIYLIHSPLMPQLFTKLLKSCPLYLVACYVRIFIKASTRMFFHLLILKQERIHSLKHPCCQSPAGWPLPMVSGKGKV